MIFFVCSPKILHRREIGESRVVEGFFISYLYLFSLFPYTHPTPTLTHFRPLMVAIPRTGEQREPTYPR